MEDNKLISSLNKEIIINGVVKGHILDLSESGVLVHVLADFLPGAVLDLDFTIDGRKIKVTGAIQRIRPGTGIDIEFLDLSPDDRSSISKFVDSQFDVPTEEAVVRKILLVEDSAQLRTAYRDKLLREGFKVIDAQSGTDAFARLQEMKFDLVILDLWIEGIDGFKVLHIIRSSPALKGIPVLVLSARSTPADIEKAMALGATEYLVKAATPPMQLAEKVKELFLR